MRLIDADELVKDFLNHCRTKFEIKNHCLTDENVLFLIQNVPTVEPDLKLFKEWKCADCKEREEAYNAGYQKAIKQCTDYKE